MSLISTFTRLQDQKISGVNDEIASGDFKKSIRKASMLFFWFFEINDWTRASVNLERASVSHTKDDRISLMSLISTFTRLQDQRYPVLAIEIASGDFKKSIRKASMLFFWFFEINDWTRASVNLERASVSHTKDDRISLMSLISTFTRLQDQRYPVLAIEIASGDFKKSIRKASMLFFWFFEINDCSTRASVNLERASVNLERASHHQDDRISLMSLISTFTRLQDQRYPVLTLKSPAVISKIN